MQGDTPRERGKFSAILHIKTAKTLVVILCLILLIPASFFIYRILAQKKGATVAIHNPEIAAMSDDALKKHISLAAERIRQLTGKQEHLFPAGLAVLIDSAANRISLLKNSQVLVEDKCSTGMGFELSDESGKRSWTFDTPRGYFKVTGKVANPIWIRPDWSFIEEGVPIPKRREERMEANVLGDYAIAFGNGFFIHGTLYTRLLGTSVTHGCVRVGDDTLKKIYTAVQTGTPIWIY